MPSMTSVINRKKQEIDCLRVWSESALYDVRIRLGRRARLSFPVERGGLLAGQTVATPMQRSANNPSEEGTSFF